MSAATGLQSAEAPNCDGGAVRPGRLDVRGLRKRYGQVAAVEELTLTVEAGEFVALLGPSGCGKSTSLRMLAGLEAPDEGQVRLSGVDITAAPAHRRHIHTVFQSYALFPHLDVFDNVAFPLRQAGVPRPEIRSRVADALSMVRLECSGKAQVRSLSGGMQQRVALARAVVDRPSLLLLDEPLSALDRSLRQEMQFELRMLQQQLGVTTVLVTHDQEEALSLADRVVIMSKGQIEQIGRPEDVYDRPSSLFVARFVGESNEFAGESDGAGGFRQGAFTLAAQEPIAAGPAIALVRPEHIQVQPAGDDLTPDPNTITGVVRGVSIAGMTCGVLVDAGEVPVLARIPRDGRGLPCTGDRVVCRWSSAHVRLFPTVIGAA